jgi:hypothetical protein
LKNDVSVADVPNPNLLQAGTPLDDVLAYVVPLSAKQ